MPDLEPVEGATQMSMHDAFDMVYNSQGPSSPPDVDAPPVHSAQSAVEWIQAPRPEDSLRHALASSSEQSDSSTSSSRSSSSSSSTSRKSSKSSDKGGIPERSRARQPKRTPLAKLAAKSPAKSSLKSASKSASKSAARASSAGKTAKSKGVAKKAAPKAKQPAAPPTEEERWAKLLMSGGKSVIRHILMDKYPEAFSAGNRPPPEHADTVVMFHDSVQLLRALRLYDTSGKKNPRLNTWRDVVMAYKNTVEFEFSNCPKLRTVVIAQDMSEYVWFAKSIEQSSRRHDIQHVDHAADMNMTLDGKLPEFWDDALGHHRLVRRILRYIFKVFLEEYDMRFGLAPGCSVIVDGHCLEPEDLRIDGITDQRVNGLQQAVPISSEELRVTPVRFEPRQKMSLCPHLQNELGEADHTIPFLMRSVAPREHMTVYSVDSDLLFILMRLRERFEMGPIWIRLAPALSSAAFFNNTFSPKQVWCNIAKLQECIAADPALSALEFPIGSMAAMYNSFGSDYTAITDKVARYHFVNTFYAYASKIGDLVTGADWELDAAAHKRLVQYACFMSVWRAKQGIKQGVAKRQGVEFEPSLPPEEPDLEIGAERVPSDVDMRAKHVALAMRILQFIGDPVLYEPRLDQYGYCRRDRTLPMSKDNLLRCNSELPEDDFSVLTLPENPHAPRPHFLQLKLCYDQMTSWRAIRFDHDKFDDPEFRGRLAGVIAGQVHSTLEQLYIDYTQLPEEERP